VCLGHLGVTILIWRRTLNSKIHSIVILLITNKAFHIQVPNLKLKIPTLQFLRCSEHKTSVIKNLYVTIAVVHQRLTTYQYMEPVVNTGCGLACHEVQN